MKISSKKTRSRSKSPFLQSVTSFHQMDINGIPTEIETSQKGSKIEFKVASGSGKEASFDFSIDKNTRKIYMSGKEIGKLSLTGSVSGGRKRALAPKRAVAKSVVSVKANASIATLEKNVKRELKDSKDDISEAFLRSIEKLKFQKSMVRMKIQGSVDKLNVKAKIENDKDFWKYLAWIICTIVICVALYMVMPGLVTIATQLKWGAFFYAAAGPVIAGIAGIVKWIPFG